MKGLKMKKLISRIAIVLALLLNNYNVIYSQEISKIKQSYDKIGVEIKKLVADQFGVLVTEVEKDTELINDLGGDSLDLIEIVLSIEEKYRIKIESHDVDKLISVNDIIKYVIYYENEVELNQEVLELIKQVNKFYEKDEKIKYEQRKKTLGDKIELKKTLKRELIKFSKTVNEV
jgi:acyl carrier protein